MKDNDSSSLAVLGANCMSGGQEEDQPLLKKRTEHACCAMSSLLSMEPAGIEQAHVLAAIHAALFVAWQTR